VSATTAVVAADPSASVFRFLVARCFSSSSDSELESLESLEELEDDELDSFVASFILVSSPSDSEELGAFFLGVLVLTSAFFSSSLSLSSELEESEELEDDEEELELELLDDFSELEPFLATAFAGDSLPFGFSSSSLEESELEDSEERVWLESCSAFLGGDGDFFFTSFFFLFFEELFEQSLDSLSVCSFEISYVG
jgi:hypothetical protein